MCNGSDAGSYVRLTDSCITQLKVQGLSGTCNESKEEEEETADTQQTALGRAGAAEGLLSRLARAEIWP